MESLEQALQHKDYKSLSELAGQIATLYKRAVPYVLNKKLGDAMLYGAKVCKEISEGLKTNSITLKEIAVLVKDAATKMTAELPKQHWKKFCEDLSRVATF